MKPDRLRPGRLPEDVVLQDPRAPVPAELGADASRALGKHLGRDDGVGPPAVADLSGAILRVPAGYPVHLVGLDPRLVDTLKQRLVPLAKQGERARRDETLLHDQEAVAVECLDLLRRERLDHDRGRSFSGS